jgi:hypothetical protein
MRTPPPAPTSKAFAPGMRRTPSSRATSTLIDPRPNPTRCPGSFVWKYQWDFDDGSTLLTGNPVVSHTFPNAQDRFVSLTSICWSGETATRLRHVCTQFGTLGCLKVNGTWN